MDRHNPKETMKTCCASRLPSLLVMAAAPAQHPPAGQSGPAGGMAPFDSYKATYKVGV